MKYNPSKVQMLQSLTGNTITLNDYVKAYYDAEIHTFPIDKLDLLQQIVHSSIEIYRKNPYTGRVNEMGNYMEDCIHQAIMKMDIGISKRLGTGYPDNCSILNGFDFPIYLDPKVSASISTYTAFRMFYTSLPSEETKKRKNIKDGYHILINYEHDGRNNLTGRYKITDLDGFVYTTVIKQEASSKDLYEVHNKVILQTLGN